MASFKRYLWALGTVGSSAPFVGLFGTVVGILKAFQAIAVTGSGGFKVVSQGIAAYKDRKYAEAAGNFQLATTRDPKDIKALHYLGLASAKIGGGL